MQLIQYAPATETVLKRPLLIVPALDQQVLHPRPQPGEILHQAGASSRASRCSSSPGSIPTSGTPTKSFEDYMREGPLAALDVDRAGDRRERGQRHRLLRRRHAAGGHARLDGGEGRQAHRSRRRFFAAQVDFTYAGDLKVFVDEEQLAGARAARWTSAAISKARRWRPPSTCCARTT